MPPDRLSTTFAALADPTRRAILARLTSGEASVKELAAPFEMTPPAVTKHLKVLQRAGLIARSRRAQWRPCRLDATPLRDVANWVEQYRRFWGERIDRLEDYFREQQIKEQKHARKKPCRRHGERSRTAGGQTECEHVIRQQRRSSWATPSFIGS
ncbi:MAG: helix-turn-helix transcriptional regulator [Betaproteobacteria bacterium]|nr:MAG: helix-turn-helix transcriptional regulator [Betaproteobacteria bacterium]